VPDALDLLDDRVDGLGGPVADARVVEGGEQLGPPSREDQPRPRRPRKKRSGNTSDIYLVAAWPAPPCRRPNTSVVPSRTACSVYRSPNRPGGCRIGYRGGLPSASHRQFHAGTGHGQTWEPRPAEERESSPPIAPAAPRSTQLARIAGGARHFAVYEQLVLLLLQEFLRADRFRCHSLGSCPKLHLVVSDPNPRVVLPVDGVYGV